VTTQLLHVSGTAVGVRPGSASVCPRTLLRTRLCGVVPSRSATGTLAGGSGSQPLRAFIARRTPRPLCRVGCALLRPESSRRLLAPCQRPTEHRVQRGSTGQGLAPRGAEHVPVPSPQADQGGRCGAGRRDAGTFGGWRNDFWRAFSVICSE